MKVFFDTETCLIAPGSNAPPLVCLSVAIDDKPASLLSWREAGPLMETILRTAGTSFVGANLPYDWLVLAAEFPTLLPLIFQAYREDRCEDIFIRQKLNDLEDGCFRGFLNSKWKWIAYQYNLDALARRFTEFRLVKDDSVRLTYGPLRDVPIADWPEAHRQYALEDAAATRAVYFAQRNPGEDAPRQCRFDFAARLMSTWGLRTDESAVRDLEKRTTENYQRIQEILQDSGLVRSDGTRDTKRAKDMMLSVCGYTRDPAGPKKYLPVGSGTRKMHLTDSGDISLSADACRESDDELLELYGEFGELKSVLAKDVKALLAGIEFPIHTRIDLAASGRCTSSKPNVQNWRRMPGIREAFRPRVGWVYAQADVEGLELATLATTCLTVFGRSALADAIDAGLDAHTDLACSILGISYEEGLARRKAKDPEFDNARQTSKVANFGFPGGLGITKMVLFARATYNVILTETQCAELKERWLSKWPEMRDYFRWISLMMTNPDGTGNIVQLISHRRRGAVTYTAACNTFFQGLGADVVKAAMWEVSQRCYDDRTNVLFGSRIVNMIHDELILETPDTPAAHDVAMELSRVMVGTIRQWIPDIRIAAPPLLMRYWSKNATAVFENGRLIPWG